MELTKRFGISELEVRTKGLAVLSPCTQQLMHFCAEHDPVLKQQATVALGKIGDPDSVEALAAVLSGDEEFAAEAAVALSRIELPTIVDRLLAVLQAASPSVQVAVTNALAGRRDRRVIDALAPWLASPHQNVKRAALRAIGASGDPGARAMILACLRDGDPDVVIEAVGAYGTLGVTNVDETLDLFEPLFEAASEAKVRASIVAVFEGCGGERLLALLKLAAKDSNPRVRANAVEVIGAMDLGERRKQSLLKPMIQEGANNRVLANVAIALGTVDTDSSVKILSRLLNSTEKWERARAVYAARFVKNERVASWFTTLFTSENDPDVLRNVLESLEHFTNDDVANCFIKALEHGNPIVRGGAARSLGRIKDSSLVDHLVTTLEKEQDPNVICEILSALGNLADASRVNLIAQYLQHMDIRVQANAIEALDTIGTVEIVPFIEPFLNSSDNRIKANAAVALWSMGSLHVVDSLRDMLGHTNPKQRSSAIYAVGELGESLRHMGMHVQKYYLLISALKEEDIAVSPPVPVAVAVEPEDIPFEIHAGTARYDFSQLRRDLDDGDGTEFPLAEIEEYFGLLAERRIKDAVQFLKAGLTKHPGNRYLLYLRSDGFRLQKNTARACEGFREVTRDHPSEPPIVNAYIHLANICSQSHELPQSLEAYFLASRAQLEILDREIDMGLEMLRQKDINEASLLLKNIISQLPLNSRIHYAAGRNFLKGKFMDDAYHHLTCAYLLNPNNGEVLLSLAFACYKTRRYGEVRILADKLRKLFGDGSPLAVKAHELVVALDKAGL